MEAAPFIGAVRQGQEAWSGAGGGVVLAAPRPPQGGPLAEGYRGFPSFEPWAPPGPRSAL